MPTNLNELKQKLREKGYKITPQRQIVLQAFLDNQDEHLSAEDVYQIVKPISHDIGIATIYRTLEVLSEMDLLQKIEFGDGRARYELNDSSELHHHHHLICLACGKVIEFDDDLLETLECSIARKSDFRIIDHQVKFYGYCSECKNKVQD